MGDGFGFEVFRYPSIHSNVPDSTLYNVFYSQLVRFSRVCNNMDGFISALKTLKGRVLAKGAKEKILFQTFKVGSLTLHFLLGIKLKSPTVFPCFVPPPLS